LEGITGGLSAPECRDSAVWAFLFGGKLIFLAIPGVPFPLRALRGAIVSIQGWAGCFFINLRRVALAPVNCESTDQSFPGFSNPPNSFDKTNPWNKNQRKSIVIQITQHGTSDRQRHRNIPGNLPGFQENQGQQALQRSISVVRRLLPSKLRKNSQGNQRQN
jgi:hypothetical protein